MYLKQDKEAFTIREPVCPRAPVSASSVTGTGPGAACKPDPEPPEEPTPRPRLGCRTNVMSQGIRRYRARGSGPNLTVC